MKLWSMPVQGYRGKAQPPGMSRVCDCGAADMVDAPSRRGCLDPGTLAGLERMVG